MGSMVGEALWTIDALGERVAAALSQDYQEPENGQVRAVPDRRTIRYYTTLGLIDRPAKMQGRTALYGRRHLEQLVAIKRLQAEGLSLGEVQERLSGLGPAALAKLARVPDAALDEATPAEERATEPEAPARARDFWLDAPSAPAPSPAGDADSVSEGEAPASIFTGLPLGGGLVMLIPALRPVAARDLAAVKRLAAPIVEELVALGLIAPGSD